MLSATEIQSVNELGRKMSDTTIRMHEAIAKKAGLSGTDHKYLNILVDRGPMTAGELAKVSGLTTGAVTGVVDRLAKAGLVKREYVKDDRRKVIIVPNKQNASKLLSPASKILREKILNIMGQRTANERRIIQQYLLDAIKEMEEVISILSSDEML